VLAQVDQVLAQKLSPQSVVGSAPLNSVAAALREGRGYRRVDVHLSTAGSSLPQGPSVVDQSRTVVPIKIASRVLGALKAETDRQAFSSADRVLLKEVAVRLARFLTSRGKVLMRHDREGASGALACNPEVRGYQPSSAKAASLRMAAGEGRRT